MSPWSSSLYFDSTVPVIRSARALGRDHRRAERMLRRAKRAKRGAFVGLFDTLQNQPADTLPRLFNRVIGHVETLFGVERGKRLTQAQAALRDRPDPTPLARTDS